MKEISLRATLDERRAANPEVYRKLEELINLQRPERYDQLAPTSIERYQHLRTAGFPTDSLLDQLTKSQIRCLARAIKLDASRIFHQQDIHWLAHTYGLCFYNTRFYRGQAWNAMEKDLASFQRDTLSEDNPEWYASQYSMLGVSPALNGHPTPSSRIPLLLFNLGGDFYFLVSTYDSWAPAIRRILYWPFANTRQGIITYITGFISFFFLLWIIPKEFSQWIGIPLCILYFGLFIMSMCISLLRWRDYPNRFPRWLNRMIYRVLPY